jgi:hypothetical protein
MNVSTSLGHCKVSNERKITFTLAAYDYSQHFLISSGSRDVVHWLAVNIPLERAVLTAPGCREPE